MSDIFLGIVFILIIALCIYNSRLTNQKKNLYFAVFAFVYFFIIAGFRHIDIANDTQAYVTAFLETNIYQGFWNIEGRFEPAYQYLVKFIYLYISKEPIALLIITSLIIQYLNIRFMYTHSNILWLSVFLFITLRYFFFSVSGIRQATAVGLCFLSYSYLLKEKKIHFILITLFAAIFHYSAFIFLILIILKNVEFNRKNILIIGLITCAVVILFGQIFIRLSSVISYGKDYFSQFNNSEFSSLGTILITLVLLMTVIFVFKTGYLKKHTNSTYARMEMWCLFMALLISFVAIKFTILGRFSYYFAIFSVVIISNSISVLKGKTKVNAILFWIFFSMIYIMTIFYLRPEWYNFYPYKFYWQ
jgi:hypothetical protein